MASTKHYNLVNSGAVLDEDFLSQGKIDSSGMNLNIFGTPNYYSPFWTYPSTLFLHSTDFYITMVKIEMRNIAALNSRFALGYADVLGPVGTSPPSGWVQLTELIRMETPLISYFFSVFIKVPSNKYFWLFNEFGPIWAQVNGFELAV